MVLIHFHVSIDWVKFTILSFVLGISVKIWMDVLDLIVSLLTNSVASITLFFLDREVLHVKLLVWLISNVS
jgi:hypothetical protein